MIARLGAASVHLLTASGAVLALLALRPAHQHDWQITVHPFRVTRLSHLS